MRYSIQHDNITTTASRGQGGSRFEPQPKGYGMSQNHHFECPQATFDSILVIFPLSTNAVKKSRVTIFLASEISPPTQKKGSAARRQNRHV